MSKLLHTIFFSIIFAKWINGILPLKELLKDDMLMPHALSEANLTISTKRTLSEQINDSILSNRTYYVAMLIIAYTLSVYAFATYLNHFLQFGKISKINKFDHNKIKE
jgi:hypothetical protein